MENANMMPSPDVWEKILDEIAECVVKADYDGMTNGICGLVDDLADLDAILHEVERRLYSKGAERRILKKKESAVTTAHVHGPQTMMTCLVVVKRFPDTQRKEEIPESAFAAHWQREYTSENAALDKLYENYKGALATLKVLNVVTTADYVNGIGTWILFASQTDIDKATNAKAFPDQAWGGVSLALEIPYDRPVTCLWTDRPPAPFTFDPPVGR